MKVVFLSDCFNHHQKPLADCFFDALGDDYHFVEMKQSLSEYRKNLGFKEYDVPYTVKYIGNEAYVDQLIMDADVVICGEAPAKLIKKRITKGKLTFRDDERRYKGIIKYLKYPIYTWSSLVFNKGYLLSASAYGARDYVISGMKPSKCFKWGYFTEVKEIADIDSFIDNKKQNTSIKRQNEVSILWVGRLVELKHPEMAIEVAKRLKEEGFQFHLNMVGPGNMYDSLMRYIANHNLTDCVSLLGQKGQDDVRKYMEQSQIFMFTSDEREGWGAVLNESMASACATVASHAAGSSTFLIKDGDNGFIFKSKDVNALYSKVRILVENEALRVNMCKNAYNTMRDTWNAGTACHNFLKLVNALNNGEETPIIDGPCSKAPIINHTWI